MILVLGASGTVGSALLPQLAAAGVAVRALARSAPGRAAIESHGFEAVEGDLDDPGSLERAMEGCGTMFLLSPPHPEQAAREMRAVDIARRAGVNLVVALSVTAADRNSPVPFSRWHGEIDDHLVASGMDHTLLRPAGFMQTHLLPVDTIRDEGVWYGMTGEGAAAYVDAEDVAAAAAAVLTTPGHSGAVYELTGPAAITMGQAAAQLAGVIGREISYVDLPADRYRAGLQDAGLPAWLVDSIVGLYGAIRAGHAATVTNWVERLTGRSPRSYREFAEDQREAFTAGQQRRDGGATSP